MHMCMCDWVTLLYSRKLTEHCKPVIMEKNKNHYLKNKGGHRKKSKKKKKILIDSNGLKVSPSSYDHCRVQASGLPSSTRKVPLKTRVTQCCCE